jgi:hypothetical protein
MIKPIYRKRCKNAGINFLNIFCCPKAIRIRFLILVFLLVVTLCSFFPSNIFLLIVSALFLIIITKKIIINTKIN